MAIVVKYNTRTKLEEEFEVMITVIGSFYPITACLVKMLREIGSFNWKAINLLQSRFLKIFDACKSDVEQIKEIESEVGIGTVVPVNAFLRRKNIDIQLDSISPKEIAVASVLDLLVEWIFEGQPSIILKEAKEYPAALLNRGVCISKLKNFTNPVATITSKTEDRVLMTILTEQPASSFEVFNLACKLIDGEESSEAAWNFEGVKFPMVNLDLKQNIEWLIGMRTNGWNIGQAIQQIKLKMNEKGARIREAVAIGAEASPHGEELQPLIIDKSFLLVFQRPGLKHPLFSAFLAEDCWENPRSLDI